MLKEMDRMDRLRALKVNFAYFILWYFPHYINYTFADFHYEMVLDVHDLVDGTIKELAWIQYRESGKTSFAKALLLYLICFRLDDYINVDSYDKENAERILFDCVWELQTNERIRNDFGDIYNVERDKDKITQKRISNFITNPPKNGTGIRVEAHSTQEPIRGRLHGAKRPGFIILDDFENRKTIESEQYTKNIREHIQEFKGGLDTSRGRVLYLANYLSEFANVQSIIERSKVDPKLRVRIVPIEDETGPTWPEKYTNKGEKGKVSIQELKQKMWTPESGDDDFMAEMMCKPVSFANSDFKKEWIDDSKYIMTQLEGKRTLTFISFDNAPSQNETSDYIGCNVIKVDDDNIWYSVYVKRYRLNTPELIDEIFRLDSIYKPVTIGIEQKAFKGLIEPFIKLKAIEYKRSINVIELKDQGKNKEDRIRGTLQGRFKTGMIKLQKFPTDDTNILIKELADFPFGKHDDCIDSMNYLGDFAYPPKKIIEPPKTMREIMRDDIKRDIQQFGKTEIPDVI